MAAAVLASIPSPPYINGYAVIPVLVVLVIWAKFLTWVDKDSTPSRLPRQIINAGLFAGLALAIILLLMPPLGMWASLSIYVGLFVVDVGVYLGLRWQKVGLGDLKEQFHGMFQSSDKKQKKDAKLLAGHVTVINKAGVPMPMPDQGTPERQQYEASQTVLIEPLKRGAERIELVASSEGAAVSYLVDGFQYDGQGMDRAAASAVVTYFKFIAGLDINEKRKPQSGPFKTVWNNAKREMKVITRGSSSGESMTIVVEPKKRHGFTLEQLGFGPEQLQTIKDVIADGNGLVLVTTPPGHGLTALEYAILRAHDAFLQHLLTIERNPEADLEGITQNTLPVAATAAEEAKQVAWVVSQEPDVIMMSHVEDSNSARDLAGFAESAGKRAYVGLRAGSAFDALKQWRKLVGDDNLAVKSLRLIVAGRTLRRLCQSCKVGYTPDPTLLKKLNMDPAKVTKLFQARTQPARDAKGNPIPCELCGDLAFKGRTGAYELLVIDDEMRQLILNNGTENELKKAFRNQKGRYLQEMALELVETGDTSVSEVQRVLRPGGEAAPARASAPSSEPEAKPSGKASASARQRSASKRG